MLFTLSNCPIVTPCKGLLHCLLADGTATFANVQVFYKTRLEADVQLQLAFKQYKPVLRPLGVSSLSSQACHSHQHYGTSPSTCAWGTDVSVLSMHVQLSLLSTAS